MLVPDRRTLIVLASLVSAMTVASSVLLLLEPGPAKAVKGMSLASIDRTPHRSGDGLFDHIQTSAPGRWSAVVIHYGSAPLVTPVVHTDGDLMPPGDDLAYHFLIRRGRGPWREQVAFGGRWRDQQDGAYWAGPESRWVNHHAIGICLEDDGTARGPAQEQLETLIGLVQRLQTRFQIPADRVILQIDTGQAAAGARWFPVAWFRQQLLTFAAP